MPPTLVRRGSNAGTSVVSLVVANGTTNGAGGTVPAQNNLLIAWANADATVTFNGSGFTAVTPIVDGNGCYVWWKVAGASEPASLTFTPSAAANIDAGYEEWSGCATPSPLDTSTSFTGPGSAGTSAGPMSVTPTVAGDLLWWITMAHSYTGSAPVTPTWTTYTLGARVSDGFAPGAGTTSFIGTQIAAGTAAVSDTNNWTNAAADRNGFVLAFKAAAGGSTVRPGLPNRRFWRAAHRSANI